MINHYKHGKPSYKSSVINLDTQYPIYHGYYVIDIGQNRPHALMSQTEGFSRTEIKQCHLLVHESVLDICILKRYGMHTRSALT